MPWHTRQQNAPKRSEVILRKRSVQAGRVLHHCCIASVVARGATLETPTEPTELSGTGVSKARSRRQCIFSILQESEDQNV